MRFAVVVHKEKGSSYGVTVPDLPGCFSGGDTLDEAITNVQEAILLHLEGMLDAGEPIPKLTPLQTHVSCEDYAGGVWALVEADLADVPDKAIRVNITVPSRMLTAIDAHAQQEGETRSGFLTRVALQYIGAKAAE